MSHHVVMCRVDINGLFVRGSGTYSAGQTFPIEQIPDKLFEKALAGDTAIDHKGKRVDIVSWMTPQGLWIRTRDAYIPRFNHGKPPTEDFAPDVISNKKRNAESLVKEEASSKSEVVQEVESSESESSDEVKVKKKIKIGKGIKKDL